MKVCTPVSLNITQVSKSITSVSLNITQLRQNINSTYTCLRLALNDGNGNTIQLKNSAVLQSAFYTQSAVCSLRFIPAGTVSDI